MRPPLIIRSLLGYLKSFWQAPIPSPTIARYYRPEVEAFPVLDLLNVAPVVGSLQLNLSAPKTNDVLAAEAINVTDADNDPVLCVFEFYVNNTLQQTTMTMGTHVAQFDLSQSGFGDKGDQVAVKVKPYDFTEWGEMISDLVTVANSAPTATNHSGTIDQDGSLELEVDELFADVDGDAFVVSIPSAPSHGEITVGNGVITYAPTSGFNGVDSFSVSVEDGSGGSATAVVSVVVRPLVSLSSTQFFDHQGESATITVQLSGTTSEDVTVYYTTSNGTAEASEDYTSTSGFVTIEAGQTSATFSVPLLTDPGAAHAEEFKVTLSNPSNAGLGVAEANVSILIALDEEEDPVPRLNELAGEIDDLLGAIANDVEGIETLLDTMLDLITDMRVIVNQHAQTFDQTGAAPFDVKRVQYNNARGFLSNNPEDLRHRIYEVMLKADDILAKANEAANRSQGERFRIEGIGSALFVLNQHLGTIWEGLETQRENLALLSSRIAEVAEFGQGSFHYRNIESIRTAFERQKDLLWDYAEYFVEPIYFGHLNDPTPEGEAGDLIRELNDDYDALVGLRDVLILPVHEDAIGFDADMTLAHDNVEVLGDWDLFETAEWNFSNRIDINTYWIALGHPTNDGTSALDVAIETRNKQGVQNDDFAMAGLNSLLEEFYGFLTEELELAEAQWDWVDEQDESLAKQAALFNLTQTRERLEEAIERMDNLW